MFFGPRETLHHAILGIDSITCFLYADHGGADGIYEANAAYHIFRNMKKILILISFVIAEQDIVIIVRKSK